jgi:hypothetical protein
MVLVQLLLVEEIVMMSWSCKGERIGIVLLLLLEGKEMSFMVMEGFTVFAFDFIVDGRDKQRWTINQCELK